jgi:hypothetical protein
VNIALWVVQWLLAALFLWAGGFKLVMPLEAMQGPVAMPGWFLRFIAVCEVLGALGLVLPGLSRIASGLTPLAALGLVILMIGATVISMSMGIVMAAVPFVTGLAAAFVAYGRWRLVPHGRSSRTSAVPVR